MDMIWKIQAVIFSISVCV